MTNISFFVVTETVFFTATPSPFVTVSVYVRPAGGTLGVFVGMSFMMGPTF